MISCESIYDAEKKEWSGRKWKPIFNPMLSLGEAIRYSLWLNPKKVGQISADTEVHLTNEEISRRSLKIASFIQKKGLKIGDVGGVIARNSENLAPLVFGLLYCGVAVNALDMSFTKDEVMTLFETTKPRIVFCDADKYLLVKEALHALANKAITYIVHGTVDDPKAFSVADILAQTSEKDANEFRPNEPDDGRTRAAVVMCTSGTTGPPKGVAISHASLLSIFMDMNAVDIVFCFSTLYWFSGISTLLMTTLRGATRVITTSVFNADLVLKIMQRYKVTLLSAPPSQLAMILQSSDLERTDLSSLKKFFCAGSYVPPLLCEKMDSYLPNGRVINSYGLSEIGGCCNSNTNPHKYGSVGKLLPNVTLKIINGEKETIGPNQNGEICLKSPHQFLGYYVSGKVSSGIDAEGWIHSGDIGYVDDEGFLFVSGRSKEMLEYNTFHFSPNEIEEFLLNLPEVKQACVCGIPDPVCIELPAVLIVRKIGASITESDIHEHMRKRFSDNKQLRGGVYFVDEIPMTGSGKHQRNKAKDIAIQLYKTHGQNIHPK